MEIERKFIVDKHPPLDNPISITQAYICIGIEEEVRIRRESDGLNVGYTITCKSGSGVVREEHEIDIDMNSYLKLLKAAKGRFIEKDRYIVPECPEYSVDIYKGKLQGLKIAEVEFSDERSATLWQPEEWVGKEVTNDKRFKNSSLAVNGLPEDFISEK